MNIDMDLSFGFIIFSIMLSIFIWIIVMVVGYETIVEPPTHYRTYTHFTKDRPIRSFEEWQELYEYEKDVRGSSFIGYPIIMPATY